MSNHSSSFQRQSPVLPHAPLNLQPSRKPSIVEMLSSPPPLPVNPNDHEDIHSLSLSRNTSISSRASSVTPLITDWAEIPLYDLIESNKLIFIDSEYSVKQAFETLISHNLTSVPVSDTKGSLKSCSTFDYSDLNTYLLLIMDKIPFAELSIDTSDKTYNEYIQSQMKKAKKGEEVSVNFITNVNPKNSFIKFNENDVLYNVMEALGNGVHRVAITDSLPDENIVGILSQRRLIKFMWENARRFPSLDFLFNSTLQELDVGSSNPITIYEDQPLIEALYKMFKERISSLAVVDRSKSLIGNISIVDVQNVSSSKNSHLLFKSVLHFISYNLTQKGIEKGQDQFPIFHVNKQTSLGRVIAKLVATQSHRLWIVQSPQTANHSSISSGSGGGSISGVLGSPSSTPSTVEALLTHQQALASLATQSATSESGRQGTLIGVITLTDILGLFASAKANGKKIDPQLARNQRRRSSTSTTRSSSEISTNPELFRKSFLGGSMAKAE